MIKPANPMPSKHEYIEALQTATACLLEENGYSAAVATQRAPSQLRNIASQLLCVRSPSEKDAEQLSSVLYDSVDVVLAFEANRKTLIDAQSLRCFGDSRIVLWKGDITTLKTDVIVNAANSALLGCFKPDHKCIDNIIHANAGPRLRDACAKVVLGLAEPDGLPVGQAAATPGFHLPAHTVFHTVGPQIQRNTLPTDLQNNQLVSCYLNCLDLALTLAIPTLSIAFPCISTGLYGFPSERAAPLVIQAVKIWIATHPQASNWKVIFNTFLDKDHTLYSNHLLELIPDSFIPPQPSTLPQQFQKAKELMRNADYLIVSAGAGLSASAGLDYTSAQVFQNHHPVMHARGFNNMYQFIGYQSWTPALQWGYLFSQTRLARYSWPQHATQQSYPLLKTLIDDFEKRTTASTFIVTSNADGMFNQYGFEKSRIYTRQGDYSRIQCLQPCSNTSVWDILPFLEKGLEYLDPTTNEITNPDAIPKCCNCDGPVMLNVRGGDWFIETEYLKQKMVFEAWKAGVLHKVKTEGKKLVVLELGAGFNTPGVLRYPNEKLAEEVDGVALVRLNRDHAEIPVLADGVGVNADCTDVLKELTL
ncbi:UNVERIFIED_CONTAM: hypothetical protein HDU68_001955 [Siphonaria sp. JEL0065]|nr:hypothetical protein HDU68_001955 [Siphonaria sp. JEL0065]